MLPHAPTHHWATEQVNHLIRRLGREVARQQVRRYRQIVAAVGCDDKLSLSTSLDAVALHQPPDTLIANPKASSQQFFPHSGPAVFSFDLGVNGSNVYQQGCVADARPRLPGLVRTQALPVPKVAAGADAQHFTGQRDRPLRFVPCDPGVLQGFPREIRRRFFRMSRSIFRRAHSARRRAKSICSALTGLSPTPFAKFNHQLWSTVCGGKVIPPEGISQKSARPSFFG